MPVANARTMHLETVVKSGLSTQCGNKMCILRMLKWHQFVHNLSIACVRFEVKVYFCKNFQDWNLKLFLGEVQTFPGNQKTHNDHFKLLHQDGSSLLIGARNSVYNTSLEVSCDWWISNLAGSSSLIGQDLWASARSRGSSGAPATATPRCASSRGSLRRSAATTSAWSSGRPARLAHRADM